MWARLRAPGEASSGPPVKGALSVEPAEEHWQGDEPPVSASLDESSAEEEGGAVQLPDADRRWLRIPNDSAFFEQIWRIGVLRLSTRLEARSKDLTWVRDLLMLLAGGSLVALLAALVLVKQGEVWAVVVALGSIIAWVTWLLVMRPLIKAKER